MDDQRHRGDALTRITWEAVAMGKASQRQDFDAARGHVRRMAAVATEVGYEALLQATMRLIDCLGPCGTAPGLSYGAALLSVADELHALRIPASGASRSS